MFDYNERCETLIQNLINHEKTLTKKKNNYYINEYMGMLETKLSINIVKVIIQIVYAYINGNSCILDGFEKFCSRYTVDHEGLTRFTNTMDENCDEYIDVKDEEPDCDIDNIHNFCGFEEVTKYNLSKRITDTNKKIFGIVTLYDVLEIIHKNPLNDRDQTEEERRRRMRQLSDEEDIDDDEDEEEDDFDEEEDDFDEEEDDFDEEDDEDDEDMDEINDECNML
jgi:hypothetical protein